MKLKIDMIDKLAMYALGALGVCLVAMLLFSPKFRNELPVMWAAASGSVVDKLEAQLDQGTMALVHFDEEYAKAEQKLSTLRHLRLDAQHSMQRAREAAEQYRRQGKNDLASRNEEQALFFDNQLSGYEAAIQKRSEKLVELKRIRELAREDVRLARERIAMLQATRDAMDSRGQEEMLEKARQNIHSLQSHCNQLSAEIEVIGLTE